MAETDPRATGDKSPARPVADERRLLDLVIKNLPIGFFAVDKHQRINEFNAAAERITGYAREDALGLRCSEILRSDLCLTDCPLGLGVASGRCIVSQQAFIHTKDRREIPVLFTSAPIMDEEGHVFGGIEIFHDMSERHRLDEQRAILISMFAHDLKAPVAIAGGFLGRLLNGKCGPLSEKQREYLETIDKEIGRLHVYIHSFLDILRMEAGQITLSVEQCSIRDALIDLIEGFRLKADKKGIDIHTEIAAQVTSVYADREYLQRAVSNLIDNAIKYSPEGREVFIRVDETPHDIVFEIKDTGLGIPAEHVQHIFEPFYRVRVEGRVSEPGSGLGLAVVRSVIEAHGGKIRVNSHLGEGTTFSFVLPKQPARRR